MRPERSPSGMWLFWLVLLIAILARIATEIFLLNITYENGLREGERSAMERAIWHAQEDHWNASRM